MKPVLFFAIFPPPINGASFINEQFSKRLNLCFFILNTHVYILKNSFLIKLLRVKKILFSLIFLLLSSNTNPFVIIALNGKLGLVYDLVFSALSFLKKKRLCFLHNNYTYINKFYFLTYFLNKLCIFSNGCNVFLSQKMKSSFFQKYGSSDFFIISNSFFLKNVSESCLRTAKDYKEKKPVIGFISNLTKEKGLYIFLETVKLSVKNKNAFTFLLAGPIAKETDRDVVSNFGTICPCFTYLGPIYDKKKNNFFNKINYFLFPSLYDNEAEPVSILEAMSHGVPVFALNRGTISTMLDSFFILSSSKSFPELSLRRIHFLQKSKKDYLQASLNAKRRLLKMQIDSKTNFTQFKSFLLSEK